MSIIHLGSLSGGKDSGTTAMVMQAEHGPEVCRYVMADTGNEEQITMEYALDYLPRALGIHVHVVKADFTDEFATKRANLQRIADGEPESAVYGSREFQYAWTPEAARSALELLHPTGNPYLDLCMVRGGFPSRKRQFCTEYLKTRPLTEYALSFIEQGHAVWSWQGVRLEESESRRTRLQGTGACVRSFDVVGGGLFNYRPILRWKWQDVVEAHRYRGIKMNPLYSMGMTRVGCMPCINAQKSEVREIARRFPEHIDRIAEWERLVSSVSRPRSPVTFFHIRTMGKGKRVEFTPEGATGGIREIVEWSKTTRGGKQFNLLDQLEDAAACSSAYGQCE